MHLRCGTQPLETRDKEGETERTIRVEQSEEEATMAGLSRSGFLLALEPLASSSGFGCLEERWCRIAEAVLGPCTGP